MKTTLVIMAAGKSSRFGRLKQFEKIGIQNSYLLEFGIYDAIKAGFRKVIIIIQDNHKKHLIDLEKNLSEKIENGVMMYQDIKFKPLFSKLSFSLRYTYFNTESYESRIYAYESDVLYGYSIPAYYGKGKKIYLLLKYNIIKNTDLWIKLSETTYNDRDVIKTGWEEIQGNKLSELKVQLRYKF